MPRLGVVGLVSLDRVDGGLPRLGGAPYYAARALRLLHHPAVVATKVAPEDRPRLAALGLPVVARDAERTISFAIENSGDGRRLRLEELGEPFTAADARGWVGAAVAGCAWAHAGALTRADFSAESLAALRRGRLVCLDGQALVRPGRLGDVELDADYDPEVLRHVDALKLSLEELDALGLTLHDRSLASLGVREVVVTLGSKGSVVFADGLAERIPAHALAGVDPTGAGDAFAAAYLTYRARRHSPLSAARLATGVTGAMLRQPKRNSPRATMTAEPPTSTFSTRSAEPSARA
jgi:sugar/nucleoside kinase (ribokinase family)